MLCSGIIRNIEKATDECIQIQITTDQNLEDLDDNDVYNELQMRGFQYSGSFRSIIKSSSNASNGSLIWQNNWITFLEGMFQIFTLGNDVRKIQLPIKIRKIVIDRKVQKSLKNTEGEYLFQKRPPYHTFSNVISLPHRSQ